MKNKILDIFDNYSCFAEDNGNPCEVIYSGVFEKIADEIISLINKAEKKSENDFIIKESKDNFDSPPIGGFRDESFYL